MNSRNTQLNQNSNDFRADSVRPNLNVNHQPNLNSFLEVNCSPENIRRGEGVKRKLNYDCSSDFPSSDANVELTELLPVISTNKNIYNQPTYMQHDFNELTILQLDEKHEVALMNNLLYIAVSNYFFYT